MLFMYVGYRVNYLNVMGKVTHNRILVLIFQLMQIGACSRVWQSPRVNGPKTKRRN